MPHWLRLRWLRPRLLGLGLIALLLLPFVVLAIPGCGGGGDGAVPAARQPDPDPLPEPPPTPDPDPDPLPAPAGGLVADHLATDLGAIPILAIEEAVASLHIVYQHTSHGSQLTSGMNALEHFPAYGDVFAWDDGGSASGGLDLDDYGIPGCADLSQGDSVDGHGDTPWVIATRTLLDDPSNAHVNVVVWSWCSINGHDAQRYVDNMEKLILEYPDVAFVFLTGHAEGQGEDLTSNHVHFNNELIRRHCETHGRWLFDFADIEAHDPDGTYFWDLDLQDNLDHTGGNWAVDWLAANSGSELDQLATGEGVAAYDGCTSCAHSDSPGAATLNCVMKGRAIWWLWARIAGWDPSS